MPEELLCPYHPQSYVPREEGSSNARALSPCRLYDGRVRGCASFLGTYFASCGPFQYPYHPGDEEGYGNVRGRGHGHSEKGEEGSAYHTARQRMADFWPTMIASLSYLKYLKQENLPECSSENLQSSVRAWGKTGLNRKMITKRGYSHVIVGIFGISTAFEFHKCITARCSRIVERSCIFR